MAQKKYKGSDYFSDKSFVFCGVGVLSLFTRLFYLGDTPMGRVFVIFAVVMLVIGGFSFIQYIQRYLAEKNATMTVGYAMYLLRRYAEHYGKKTDKATVEYVKASMYLLKFLEEQGYVIEQPYEFRVQDTVNTIDLNVENDVDCENKVDVNTVLDNVVDNIDNIESE